jgi:hypothetical protein
MSLGTTSLPTGINDVTARQNGEEMTQGRPDVCLTGVALSREMLTSASRERAQVGQPRERPDLDMLGHSVALESALFQKGSS